MSTALDMLGTSASMSPDDAAGIDHVKAMIQEKQDELAGSNGYSRVPDGQLNTFADYVVQDMEQADQTYNHQHCHFASDHHPDRAPGIVVSPQTNIPAFDMRNPQSRPVRDAPYAMLLWERLLRGGHRTALFVQRQPSRSA